MSVLSSTPRTIIPIIKACLERTFNSSTEIGYPETTLWFHHFGRRLEEKVRINTLEAERMRENFCRDEGKYFRIIEERTGGKTSKKKAQSLLRNEETLNAKEAVKLGFAHEIISVKNPS